ncbi:probable serine/threonine-protein kinase Sps1 [Ptychodera flava]|uniref:probable serine/threonine-protein kinase Sps1 n=1 Tax=Ptychodera flava TaxID=63121 RepID=UPI00396A4992
MGGGYYGLVQEYAAGKTLEMMLLDGDLDKLTLSEKLDLACQLCDAVDHCHKHNIIHQNIHPGHIIVNPETLNVTLVPTSTTALIGDAGRFRGLGETRYLSPESVLDNRAITYREDVWSLGMVLAEIFTGFRPYLNHPDLFSASDYAVFHENNRELPRFRQAQQHIYRVKHLDIPYRRVIEGRCSVDDSV